MRALRLLFLGAALTSATGCATTHLARPLGVGQTRVNLTVGGPLATLGSVTIPAPLTSLSVAHGMSDLVDVSGGIHPLLWAFSPGNGSTPILGADLGVAVHPIPGARGRPALTLGAQLYGFTNRLDALVMADLWASTGVYPTRWLFLGAGLHNTLRLGVTDAEVGARSVWQGTAFTQVALIFGRVQLETELKWYAFTENGFRTAAPIIPVGPFGALGIQLGFSYQFQTL